MKSQFRIVRAPLGPRVRPLAGILVSALLVSISLWAAPITQQQAGKAAETFIVRAYPAIGQKVAHTVTKFGESHLAIHRVRPLIEAGQVIGFVADLEPTGYVLLSADDEAPAIKLYTDDGTFDSLPPEFMEVIKLELSEDLGALAEMKRLNKPINPKYSTLWSGLTNPEGNPGELAALSSYGPGTFLLTTIWNQDNPYNWYCPGATGGPDGRAYVGCNACALAQILRYKSLPISLDKDYTYTDSLGTCTGTHSIHDAGMGEYDWAEMTNTLTTSSPHAQSMAIGRLMYHIAVALRSDFEADQTTASANDVPYVLLTYFTYANGGYYSKSDYSSFQWYNKIAADINADKPIYYAMWNSVGGDGHAVACDGYQGGNQIHLNLGWGGSCNAWYNIDTVKTNGHTWTQHSAVFGITPPSAGFQVISNRVDDPTSIRSCNNNNGTLESGETVRIYPRVANTGSSSASQISISLVYTGSILELSTGSQQYPDLGPGNSAEPFSGYYVNNVRADFTGYVSADVHVQWYENGTNVLVIPNGLALYIAPAAWLGLSPKQWDFGLRQPGSNVTTTLTVQNVGSTNLHVTAIQTNSTDTSWSGEALPWTLSPGQSKQITITINTAGLNGNISRTIQVASDGRIDTLGQDRLVINGMVTAAQGVFLVPGSTNVADSTFEVDVSGNIVVWLARQNGSNDIYACDLTTSRTFPVCTNRANQFWPRISGNLVAWKDLRNWNGLGDSHEGADIYAYDLTAGKEFAVATNSVGEGLIGVDGSRIYFTRTYTNLVLSGTSTQSLMNVFVYDRATSNTTQLTSYTRNSSHNPMSTGGYMADVGGGFLTFEEDTYNWVSTHWTEGSVRTLKMRIGVDSAPVATTLTTIPNGLSADNNRFVWHAPDVNADQVWIWNNGVTSQVTTEARDHDLYNNLAINGSFIVYDKNGLPGLYLWDLGLTSNQETLLTDQTNRVPEDVRMDGRVAVWKWVDGAGNMTGVYYTFLKQPILALNSADISFTQNAPIEGSTIGVGVTVHNVSGIAETNSVTIRLYDGNPNAGGTQLGTNLVFTGGIGARGQATVNFTNILVGLEGVHQVYVQVSAADITSAPNTLASAALSVQDSDTTGPTISNVSATEYNGDGDGVISAIEQIKISYTLTDPSGIGSTQLLVDNTAATVNVTNGIYYAIVGPLSGGSHQVEIRATDADTSPASTTNTYSFFVVADTDRDGIPDSWMNQYFGHPRGQASDRSRAQDDADGTGQNNLFKYVAGLDPTNSASVFVLKIATALNNGLVAYYPFDGNANDASGNGNNATRYGATFVQDQPGNSGQALQFNGASDYVEAPSLQQLNPTNITVSAWIKQPDFNLFAYETIVATAAFRFQTDSARKLRCDWRLNSGPRLFDDGQVELYPPAGAWCHVAFTRAYTNMVVYLNGTSASLPSALGTAVPPISKLRVGRDGLTGIGTDDYFSGIVDEVRIYNRALSPIEVQQLYQSKSIQLTQPAILFGPVADSRIYTPQFSTDLVNGVWLPLLGYEGPVTNGNQITITDGNAIEPQKFYRVHISLP